MKNARQHQILAPLNATQGQFVVHYLLSLYLLWLLASYDKHYGKEEDSGDDDDLDEKEKGRTVGREERVVASDEPDE